MSSTYLQVKRVADKSVYLSENRFNEPKEIFKFIVKLIKEHQPNVESILDIGCATGEFLYYANKEIKTLNTLYGVDVVASFFERGQIMLPNAKFICGDISDENFKIDKKFNSVILIGVLGILFDPKCIFHNVANLLSENGVLYISHRFNEEPIDVHLAYRRSGVSEQWESGHNVYSMCTIESITKELGMSVEWFDFKMPFPIKKSSDPMRSWTEPFRDDPHTTIYGTGQIIPVKVMKSKFVKGK